MRPAGTYRASRRNSARAIAKHRGTKLRALWHPGSSFVVHSPEAKLLRAHEKPASSKYMPHQGARECARRVARMA